MPRPLPARHAWVVALLILISTTAFAISGALVWRQSQLADTTVEAARTAARQTVRRTARTIDATLQSIVPVVRQLAEELTRTPQLTGDVYARIERQMSRHRMLTALGIAFERQPGTARPLHAPFVIKAAPQRTDRRDLGTEYDYTAFQHAWYGDAVLDGAQWHEPEEVVPGVAPLATYATPFHAPGENPDQSAPRGVVAGAIGDEVVDAALGELRLGRAGYAFIFTQDGRLVSHPREEFVRNGLTVFETAWGANDAMLHAIAIRAVQGETGFVAARDGATGQPIWIVHEPIPSAGWTLAAVLFQEDFQPPRDEARQRMFAAVMAALVGSITLVFAVMPLVLPHDGRRILVVTPTLVTLVLAGGIAGLWYAFDRYPSTEDAGWAPVYDRAGAENYLDSFAEQRGLPAVAPERRIPTGVFVSSIEFQSSTDVQVSGYIWQRYRKGALDGVHRGVILVEAVEPTVTEAYRRQDGDVEVIGWTFSGTFRQHFSYARYPFDRQKVWVRLRPADLTAPVALVPDFDAFAVPNPGALPGVLQGLVLPGWDVLGSFFEYRAQPYSTAFGIDATAEVPELYFSVEVRRQFLGPFVANLVPLVVTLAMLYGILIISSKTPDQRIEWLGFNAMDVVLGCSALFFVASFQHVALRQELSSPTVFYFEHFYFALYIAIMAVSINGIVFASHTSLKVVEYRDNLLPKLAFWPLYLTVLLALTFWVLY